MSTWAERAQAAIAQIMEAMPADATLAERRKELRRHSHSFTGGTSWGAKIWPRECRRYLAAMHGGARDTLPHQLPADIIFPFRDEGRAS